MVQIEAGHAGRPAPLAKHSLLSAMCASGRARAAPASLASLTLSLPMLSLLTVQAEFQVERLEHTIGVAMLALSLARRLLPDDVERHRVLATAGLVHDVGELYIDPVYLRKDTRLAADQWRHIVTHPLVGHRVLHEMVGRAATGTTRHSSSSPTGQRCS